jgi:hypothetical protein
MKLHPLVNGLLFDMYIRIPSRPAYRFTSTASTEGAALLLPEGASRLDILNRISDFKHYTMQNALLWYQFANEHLGREIPNGSLMLVTGCDMAFSWGIASFSDVSSDMEVELSFSPSRAGTYTWETSTMCATVRSSPEQESRSFVNRVSSQAPIILDQQPARELRELTMTLSSHTVDVNHMSQVRGNQINNITNNIGLVAIGHTGKLRARFRRCF